MPTRNKFVLSLGVLVGILSLAFHFFQPQLSHFMGKDHQVQPAEFRGYGSEEVGQMIGIDLGATYSRIGISQGGKFQIIPDKQGRIETPSWVLFTNDGTIFGEEAKLLAKHNPKNTVYNARSLLGRNFSDKEVQHAVKHSSYDIIEENGMPAIEVQINGSAKIFTPEEVVAKMIQKLKKNAELYLDRTVESAVATVPASFDDAQRAAMKKAGLLAGLEFIRLVNEPTAAGIAHRIESDMYTSDEGTVLFYNLEDHSCDVTLSTVESGVYEILSTSSSQSVGGQDFASALLDHVVSQYNQQNGNDIRADLGAIGRLRYEVEAAERILSANDSTTIEIQPRRQTSSFVYNVSPEILKASSLKVFAKTLPVVNDALKKAKVKKSAVDAIIITGDPMQVEKARPFLEEYFDGKKSLQGIPPNESFLRGAATQAELLAESDFDVIPWWDLNRLGLGIEIAGGIFQRLIPRNYAIPIRKSLNVTTTTDNQSKIILPIFEGERSMTNNNKFLATIEMEVSPAPAGVPDFEVAFELDGNYILKVILTERSTGKQETLIIESTGDSNNYQDLDGVITDAEENVDEDLAAKELALQSSGGDEKWKYSLKIKMNCELDKYSGQCIREV